ncbi:hypothetical protein [Paenibacillus dakarensis]|uniref:hypothetical protein n=1 Tax=Paenibacillus dakarensis TaxID=1527293 RepID=UPI003F95CBEC
MSDPAWSGVKERRDPALMGGRLSKAVGEPVPEREQGNWVVTRENSSRPIGTGAFCCFFSWIRPQ